MTDLQARTRNAAVLVRRHHGITQVLWGECPWPCAQRVLHSGVQDRHVCYRDKCWRRRCHDIRLLSQPSAEGSSDSRRGTRGGSTRRVPCGLCPLQGLCHTRTRRNGLCRLWQLPSRWHNLPRGKLLRLPWYTRTDDDVRPRCAAARQLVLVTDGILQFLVHDDHATLN